MDSGSVVEEKFELEKPEVLEKKRRREDVKKEREKVRKFGARDFEILRTVARLRYVTSRELRNVFFPYEDAGRKRLKVLSGQDLIRPHRKGLPLYLNYTVWRITTRGIRELAHAFPDEGVLDTMAARAGENSLREFEHREKISEVYFDLIADKSISVIRQKANQFWWQPDGETILRYEYLGKLHRIIPDVTATSRVKNVRLFVELDRSTKDLARIEANLREYRKYLEHVYPQVFKDRKAPALVYIVRSAGRKESIERVAAKVGFGRLPLTVIVQGREKEWLENTLLDVSRIVLPLEEEEM